MEKQPGDPPDRRMQPAFDPAVQPAAPAARQHRIAADPYCQTLPGVRVVAKHFASLKRAETRRQGVLALTVLFPVIGALVGVIVVPAISATVVGFVAGCFVTYVAWKLVYRYMEVVCPECGGNLQEDYANSPRFSMDKVVHNCHSCARRYVDGTLEET